MTYTPIPSAEEVSAAATVMCASDDSMHHLERTDDMPCSTCKTTATAALIAAHTARAEVVGERIPSILDFTPNEGHACEPPGGFSGAPLTEELGETIADHWRAKLTSKAEQIAQAIERQRLEPLDILRKGKFDDTWNNAISEAATIARTFTTEETP